HLFAEFDRFSGVIRNAKQDQQVGPSHHPEPDLSIQPGYFGDLGYLVLAHIDHVVKKVDPQRYNLLQVGIINFALVMEPRKVNRTQHARLIGQQGLFTARVGAFDLTQFRRRVITVNAVDEDHSGLTVMPRRLDDSIQHIGRVQLLDYSAGSRDDHDVRLAVLDPDHEFVGHCDGDVEGVQLEWIGFGGDKLFDIRMIDSKNGHVCAGSLATQLGYF